MLRQIRARALPPGGELFALQSAPTEPDWCAYLEVEETLERSGIGGILFVPTRSRMFAITFGHAYRKLSDECYEHDFGLQFILNAAIPNKLRSADVAEPAALRMKRTQGGDDSDLTLLDFKYNEDVLKSLTARVHPQYATWFESATGASSLRLNTKVRGQRLGELCELLYKVYASDTWKKNFPGAQDISRVREPSLIEALDAKLLAALQQGAPALYLAVPEIVDAHGAATARFSGAGAVSTEGEIFLNPFLQYLNDRGVGVGGVTIGALQKRYKMHVSDGASERTYTNRPRH